MPRSMETDIASIIETVILIPSISSTDEDKTESIFESLVSHTGSITAEQNLYTKTIANSLITGGIHINPIIITPAIPTVFFIRIADVVTVSMVSERSLPTTGTKLLIRNLMLFSPLNITLSVTTPIILIDATNIVATAVMVHLITFFIRSVRFFIEIFEEMHPTALIAKKELISGRIKLRQKDDINCKKYRYTGLSEIPDTTFPIDAMKDIHTGTAAFKKETVLFINEMHISPAFENALAVSKANTQ